MPAPTYSASWARRRTKWSVNSKVPMYPDPLRLPNAGAQASAADSPPLAGDPAAVMQLMRRAGIRPTIARIAIYQALESSHSHGGGFESVFTTLLERGLTASGSTVYRVIREFDAAGLLVRTQDHLGRSMFLTKTDPRVGKVYIRSDVEGDLQLIQDQTLYGHAVAKAKEVGVDWRGKSIVLTAMD